MKKVDLLIELENIFRRIDTGQISYAMAITDIRHALRMYKKKQADFEKQREIRAYMTYYGGMNIGD